MSPKVISVETPVTGGTLKVFLPITIVPEFDRIVGHLELCRLSLREHLMDLEKRLKDLQRRLADLERRLNDLERRLLDLHKRWTDPE